MSIERRFFDRRLVWVLVLGALVRLIFFLAAQDLELRMDEIQYQELAVNLVEGRGFMLNDKLTSWRPPLYSAMLAGLYLVTGTTDPTVARVFQAVLTLLMAVLAYDLGRRIFGPRTAIAAAALVAFYPSFLFYANHVLTEVLFTFLVTLAVWCYAVYLQRPAAWRAIATGLVLALAVLTRDIVWPMAFVMAAAALWFPRISRARRIGHAVALVVVVLAVLTPWVVRNTRLQGVFTMISTNGGVVFMEGNYKHTPLDRSWRAHALEGDLKVRRMLPTNVSEGERQRLAFRHGLSYMVQHPGLTVQRSLLKAANVWGLEREITGALMTGAYGKVPKAGVFAATLAITGVYALTIVGAVVGLCVALPRRGRGLPVHLFTLVLVLFVTAAHALVFGHPRYHLPLIPILALYAARTWTGWPTAWPRRVPALATASAVAALLVAIWAREVFFIDLHRFINGLSGA
jgi:4-amino-4-deoxy-L-arabinose transferase-like glycosyltransferase